MRIKVYIALGILTFYKDLCLVHGKSVNVNADDTSIERQFEDYMNCATLLNSSDCLEITGRRRKGNENAGNNVVIIGGAPSEHGSYDGGYFVEIEDNDDRRGKKGKKRKRRGKKKYKGGKKKLYKKMKPLLLGMGGMKLLFDHFLLKKLVFMSIFTFILSKIAFVLATLVALKQFFATPSGHSRDQKVEVIHIPIKNGKKKEKEWEWDESQVIPVKYQPDSVPSTRLPYYSLANQDDFISSEEHYGDSFMSKLNDNDEQFSSTSNDAVADLLTDDYDRSDKYYDEKKYYINHVHSPFV